MYLIFKGQKVGNLKIIDFTKWNVVIDAYL